LAGRSFGKIFGLSRLAICACCCCCCCCSFSSGSDLRHVGQEVSCSSHERRQLLLRET
jgi:hypothetical protein